MNYKGENYDINLDIKEISKRLRKHLKATHPDYKFSVTIERYSMGQSLNIALMSAPYKPIIERIIEQRCVSPNGNTVIEHLPVTEQYAQINHHYLKESADRNNGYVLDKRVIPVLADAVEFATGYNFDDSDIMTDYFHTNFYLHLNIGKWDKECEYTIDENRDDRIEKLSKESNAFLDSMELKDVSVEDYSI